MSPLAFVVEDDESLADIFCTTLQEARYEIEVASEGHTALARLQEITPDLILLDLHLPGVSGAEILRQIRTEERFNNTWIALATADALLADYLKRKNDRLLIALLKPISPTQLFELAERLRETFRT